MCRLRSDSEALSSCYFAFGLSVVSGVLLPELGVREVDAPPQVEIGAGVVPCELEERIAKGGLFEVGRGQFLLRLDSVARYLATNGDRIVIDAVPGADEGAVRLFLLGSVFGALLHQRGLLPLHASAIETSKGAVLFAGRSGMGKSALAAAFHARGYRVVSDEICAVHSNSGGSVVWPAFPRLLLWPDVIEQLGLWTPEVRPARANLKKHHVPLGKGFASEVLPVHAIYILTVTNKRDFGISRIAGVDKVPELIGFTLRPQFLGGMNSGNHFLQVAAMARHVSISHLAQPSTRSLRQTADFLERDFNR
ncbi:MAG: hypothetical protein ABSG41_12390 [Bryobacteraceae bacterium]